MTYTDVLSYFLNFQDGKAFTEWVFNEAGPKYRSFINESATT